MLLIYWGGSETHRYGAIRFEIFNGWLLSLWGWELGLEV